MSLPVKMVSWFFIFSFSLSAWGKDILPISSRTRALGMGNAHFAVVNDIDSIFYNPAGLARFDGLTWTLLGLGVGVGRDVVLNLESLGDSGSSGSDFADVVRDFYGDQIFFNASGVSGLTLPYLSLAVYNQTYASLSVNNPVYPEIPARFINDYGYAAGVGLPVTSAFHVGATFKRIKRSGVDTVYRVSSLTDLDADVVMSDFTQHGVGYALDLGTNVLLKSSSADFIFSGVWQNVGETKFRSGNNSRVPTEKNMMGVGASLIFDFPGLTVMPALDVTHLNRTDIQLMRKINFGVEIGLPVVDLRAGFNQGYYSFGAGIGFGPLQFEAASYGVELGEYPGQMEDRRYMVEMTLELALGSFSSSGQSSGRASTSWGGKRLKQRR